MLCCDSSAAGKAPWGCKSHHCLALAVSPRGDHSVVLTSPTCSVLCARQHPQMVPPDGALGSKLCLQSKRNSVPSLSKKGIEEGVQRTHVSVGTSARSAMRPHSAATGAGGSQPHAFKFQADAALTCVTPCL